MESLYLRLLRQWCDGLLNHQLQGTGIAAADGGLICPACKHIHGRCPDAIYALTCLADHTGEEKYLTAAKHLFRWYDNLLCDDGSAYNDANGSWNGITTFAVASLCETLVHHGHLLTSQEKRQFEERMSTMCRWITDTIGPGFSSNINYVAASAATQAMVGQYFGREDLLDRAKAAAAYVLDRFTENGLLYGEGVPHDLVTPRGCRPVDIGYDVEESVPLMIRYALAAEDYKALERLTEILRQQLAFMLPDGAWDNSFGTRCAKWTYWGSRTSDGCQAGYALLADKDPMFAAAAYRNLKLMEACTHNGLLYGGPEYHKHGEPPCIHHTFTHANAIAAALDAGIERYDVSAPLPWDADRQAVCRFPEIDTYKLSLGEWRATITSYDFWVDRGHATGGAMTLLWHKRLGPVLLSSVLDYQMLEPLNMQLTLKKSCHRPLTPRLEINREGKRYSFCYDQKAEIREEHTEGKITVTTIARLVSLEQEELPEPVGCRVVYVITPGSVRIEAKLSGKFEGARFVLPVIADEAQLSGAELCGKPEEIFFLTGGFCAREFVLLPNESGFVWAQIDV